MNFAKDQLLSQFFEEIQPETDKTRELLLKKHDNLGFVLKCHLIAEKDLTRYLVNGRRLKNLPEARLNFSQKLALIDKSDGFVFELKPCLKELNNIRNKFGHDLDASLSLKPNGALEQTAVVKFESGQYASKVILERLKRIARTEEEYKLFESYVDQMLTEKPEPGQNVGNSQKLLEVKDAREILASFVSSFNSIVLFEIARR